MSIDTKYFAIVASLLFLMIIYNWDKNNAIKFADNCRVIAQQLNFSTYRIDENNKCALIIEKKGFTKNIIYYIDKDEVPGVLRLLLILKDLKRFE